MGGVRTVCFYVLWFVVDAFTVYQVRVSHLAWCVMYIFCMTTPVFEE